MRLFLVLAFLLPIISAKSATEGYQGRSDVEVETLDATATDDAKQVNDVSVCTKALEALSIQPGKENPFNEVTFAVHRSGEAEPCGIVPPSVASMQKALKSIDACDSEDLNKYQVETFLTNMLMSQLASGTCGSTDNETAPEGLFGFCDMGPDRTVIQPDHTELVRVEVGSLPCRFYTREGLRISSLKQLNAMAEEAKAAAESCSEGKETCAAASLHVYAVPAGRVFMFAPSFVGEKFVISHVKDTLGKALIAEVISVEPRVFEIYNFFSSDEADQLVEKALKETSKTHGLHRSTTGAVDGSVYSKRTSENAWDTHGKTALAIKRRCLEFLGFDEYYESHTDGLQILRYQNAQAYTTHADYLDRNTKENYNYDTAGVGGNRFATILLYMTDLGENDGGETVFEDALPLGTAEEDKVPLKKAIEHLRASDDSAILKEGSWEERMTAMCRSRLAIHPKKGRAVLFYSQLPNGKEDKAVKHGGCPVLRGTKWAANLWVWSGARAEFPNAPRLYPEEPKPSKHPKQLHATFRNTGKDSRFNQAEVYYDEAGFFGKLGPNDPPVSVNTFEGHVWNIRVNGETLKTFVVTNEKEQVFEV